MKDEVNLVVVDDSAVSQTQSIEWTEAEKLGEILWLPMVCPEGDPGLTFRDSPEEDGPSGSTGADQAQRSRGWKKDRDRERDRDRDRERGRDRSSRTKRRRRDRLMHDNNREDGTEDSSEESVNDDDCLAAVATGRMYQHLWLDCAPSFLGDIMLHDFEQSGIAVSDPCATMDREDFG